MNEEIKVWQTQSVKRMIAMLLIMDGVSFSYNENDGIVFSSTKEYVERLAFVLTNCYGCDRKPIINEIEGK